MERWQSPGSVPHPELVLRHASGQRRDKHACHHRSLAGASPKVRVCLERSGPSSGRFPVLHLVPRECHAIVCCFHTCVVLKA